MKATYWEIALPHAAFGMLGALAGGLLVVGALLWAVRLGIKARRHEPGPPRRHEQPTLPESGPVHESREMREPDEVPRAADESERLTPYQIHSSGSRRSEKQERPRWESGSGPGSDGT
ncbi:DUF6479 family protein [Streptomyces sp. NPDC059618]|uniref:DUF6479 family protein n=1 Tax=Streptomyces sp. NPDC059618 TaxID=3346887 RepID=UPI0036C1242D